MVQVTLARNSFLWTTAPGRARFPLLRTALSACGQSRPAAFSAR